MSCGPDGVPLMQHDNDLVLQVMDGTLLIGMYI